MDLPSRDFFAEIEKEQPADEFINELNDETRAVEEPKIPDVPEQDPEEVETQQEGEPDPQPEPEQERFCTYDEEAALYVNLLYDSQKVFLPKLLEKKIITERDRDLHDQLENATGAFEITKEHEKAESKFEFLSDYKDNVELTDDEKETIRKPLAACLKMWQSSPSPTYALLFAVVTVEFSRAMPFFSKDFKKK